MSMTSLPIYLLSKAVNWMLLSQAEWKNVTGIELVPCFVASLLSVSVKSEPPGKGLMCGSGGDYSTGRDQGVMFHCMLLGCLTHSCGNGLPMLGAVNTSAGDRRQNPVQTVFNAP